MTKVKICGLMNSADVDACNTYLPEYVGFVLARPFKRYISKEVAATLKKRLDKRIEAVGVFVDSPPDEVAGFAEEGIIDYIQLHGTEDNGYMEKLRILTDKPIIRAIVVKDERDIRLANLSPADYVVLDSGKGSGKVFNWELIKGLEKDFAVAGGLNPENVGEVIQKYSPKLVDVSTGVETDGHKDPEKIRRFIEECRKYD